MWFIIRFSFILTIFFFAGLTYKPLHAEFTRGNRSVTESISTDSGEITLTNLNPWVNRWFIVSWKKLEVTRNFHIESPTSRLRLSLTEDGLKIADQNNDHTEVCPIWEGTYNLWNFSSKQKALGPFRPICNGLWFVRMNVKNNAKMSVTEKATGLLRKYSWGESLIASVKPYMVKMKAEKAAKESVAADGTSSSSDDSSMKLFFFHLLKKLPTLASALPSPSFWIPPARALANADADALIGSSAR